MLAKVKDYVLRHKGIFFVLIAYILIRLPYLEHSFLLRGERDIVLTGYSLLKTGKDFYGNVLPVQFFGLDQPSPFLSFYYAALGWLVFPIKSIFFARLPFMLAAAVNMILTYELVRLVTKNKTVSLVTAAILGFSPGYFHLSLLALEINLAMPLLLGGMILYLRQRKVWGWVLMALSFFTYNGFRPLIPFVLIYLEFYEYLEKRDFVDFIKKSFIAGILFILFFGAAYLFVDGDIMTSRSSDIVFLSYEKIEPEVVLRRNTADGPDEWKRALNNKATLTFQYITEVLFEGVSLQYLFFRGDRAAIYTSTFAGQFFATFALAYFLGFVALGKNLNRKYLYLLGFIPVALVPSLVNIDYVSVAIRSLLASVGYAYIMALGVVFGYDLLKKAHIPLRTAIVLAVLALLVIEVGYFGYNYTYRRRIMMSESYFEHERNIAEYIQNASEPPLIYDDNPKNIITAYHIITPEAEITELQRLLQQGGDEYKASAFTLRQCPEGGQKEQMYVDGTVIAESCLSFEEYAVIDSEPRHGRIPFEDISTRNSFFIYKEVSEQGVDVEESLIDETVLDTESEEGAIDKLDPEGRGAALQ